MLLGWIESLLHYHLNLNIIIIISMINQSSSKLKCFTVPAEGSEAALVASTLISTYPNTTVGFQHLRDQQQVLRIA